MYHAVPQAKIQNTARVLHFHPFLYMYSRICTPPPPPNTHF